jgi:hypothetical protein
MQSAQRVSRSNSNTRCAALRLGMKILKVMNFYCNHTVGC